MDTTITFTPAQMVEAILGLCGAIIAISAAAGVIMKIYTAAKAPNKHQDEVLKEHGEKLEQYRKYFDSDNKRIGLLEEGNRITQQAILALLAHSIDGNDIQAMKDAKDRLQQYLISK